MNILSTLLGLWSKTKNQITHRIGTTMQKIEVNGVTGQPDRIATLYTCCRVLSENFSRMPISVFIDNESGHQEMSRHRLSFLLRHQPNGYQNSQNFWSTVEYHRNYYGNAFVRVHKNEFAYPTSFEIIHPGLVREYYFSNNQLFYVIINPETNTETPIHSGDMLHFRGLSEDGIIGLSPLIAIERQTNINERATSTIDHFYENNATTAQAITSDIPGDLSGPAKQIILETRKEFQESNAGPSNAGKPIFLPVGHKIQSIAMQFADAQLIETLRFTREDISAAYGIPLFMIDGSAEKLNVEQLTTLFKNNTMGPIVAIYVNEMNSKLLTPTELIAGFSIWFDILSLVGMDYRTLVDGIHKQITNGLMTLNEGARKLGNKPVAGKYGNMHFMQAQYIPVEQYDQHSPLKKEQPVIKKENIINTENPDSDDNKE